MSIPHSRIFHITGKKAAKDTEKDKMIARKISTILISIVLALFLLSASIAFPILNRELYYAEANRLNLVEKTGYSEAEIREAYDDMMDYCTKGGERGGQTFRTGSLAFSASGKDHFDDVERLFHLDFVILVISGTFLLLCLVYFLVRKNSAVLPFRFLQRGPLFWGPVGLLSAFAVIGALAAIDFNRFFTAFHHVFFPGKENWIFHKKTDAIIRILPQEVFQYFGLIVLGTLLLLCILSILLDFILKRSISVSKGKRM